MSGFNFKSSGKKISSRKFTNVPKSKVTLRPIGLKTPLQILNNSEDLYHTHVSPDKQIKDNIKNFLLTNHGERLGRYKFGANLINYVFEASRLTESELRQELVSQITNKITEHFSSVVITDLKVILKSDDAVTESKKTLEQTTLHTRNFTTKDASLHKYNPSGIAKIVILMTFAIPDIKITNQRIETTIFVGG